jgi:sugar lactone lactonase YvrE
MDTPTTLLTGIAMGESPRWHRDRLWLSDWGARQLVAVGRDGERDITDVPFDLPFCIDWLHDGRLLIVAGREGRLVQRESDSSLVNHADLRHLGESPWNEIVVDGRGRI